VDALNPIKLTLLSREPCWIEAAEASGVERIGIDIELIGKKERQPESLKSRISHHQISDLRIITKYAKKAAPFVRLNPLHDCSRDEINMALDLGARCLMLPFFRRTSDAEQFVDLIAGRAEATLLVETGAAMMRLHELTRIPGISEIMVGMNDLHWDLQLMNPFEVAVSDMLTCVSEQVRSAGLGFGLGGLASPDTRGLPICPDLLIARYAKLRVGSSWIARSFFQPPLSSDMFAVNLERLRERIRYWFSRSPEELHRANQQLREEVRSLSHRVR
jgi:2-keto-3-deoxy-L-rhamnonate aldolase RhmA